MKADKDLTVEYGWYDELVKINDAYRGDDLTKYERACWRLIRRIQRAAFEKGAKAQIEAQRDLMRSRSRANKFIVSADLAPLVEFEDTNDGS